MAQDHDILLEHEGQIGVLKGTLGQMNDRLGAIEGRFNSLESRVDSRFNSLENRMFWMWGSTMLIMVAGFATLIVDRFL